MGQKEPTRKWEEVVTYHDSTVFGKKLTADQAAAFAARVRRNNEPNHTINVSGDVVTIKGFGNYPSS